jgi:hypothetical protein
MYNKKSYGSGQKAFPPAVSKTYVDESLLDVYTHNLASIVARYRDPFGSEE